MVLGRRKVRGRNRRRSGSGLVPGASEDVSCNRLPAPVVRELSFTALTTGFGHACALTADGSAYCWGLAAYGQVGVGPPGNPLYGEGPDLLPLTRVEGVPPFRSIAASAMFTAAIDTAGQVWAWGIRDYGGVFDGARIDVALPRRVAAALTFRSIAAGARGVCGVTMEDVTYCWGFLPSRSDADRDVLLVPPPATHLPVLLGAWDGQEVTDAQRQSWRFRNLALGWRQGCALDMSGKAWCWGAYGSPGTSRYGTWVMAPAIIKPTLQPTPLSGNHTFTSLTAGMAHECGLTPAGSVLCWGVGLSGQLGTGRDKSSAKPVPVQSGPR